MKVLPPSGHAGALLAPASVRLPAGWPLFVPFGGLLVLWLLGLTYFIWPSLGMLMLVALSLRHDVRVPPRFGIWLLFLAWALVSATQLESPDRALAFGWRMSMYLSATLLFLYVYNSTRESLPTRTVVNIVALGWVMVVVGGLLGIAAPRVSLHSAVELVLPENLLQIDLLRDMVTPALAKDKAFAALPIYRTQAPFPYPNAWGSNFVLLTPFAIWAARDFVRSRWRHVLYALIVASVVPFFFSLNRGAWLALAVGLAYAALRLLLLRDLRAIRLFVGGAVLLAVLLLLTPLKEIVAVRLDSGYSDEGRLGRTAAAVQLIQESPVFGYGSPVQSDLNPANAAVGTHGQLWLVLVSHGLPGAALFLGWLLHLLFRHGKRLRGASDALFWPHVVILMALLMSPYYELLPMQMHTIMIAAALVCRESLARRRPNLMEGRPALSSTIGSRLRSA